MWSERLGSCMTPDPAVKGPVSGKQETPQLVPLGFYICRTCCGICLSVGQESVLKDLGREGQ